MNSKSASIVWGLIGNAHGLGKWMADYVEEDEDGEEVKIDMELLEAHVKVATKFMDYCDSADCSNCPFRCCNTKSDCENAYNKMLEGKSWFDAMTEYMNEI